MFATFVLSSLANLMPERVGVRNSEIRAILDGVWCADGRCHKRKCFTNGRNALLRSRSIP